MSTQGGNFGNSQDSCSTISLTLRTLSKQTDFTDFKAVFSH